MVCTVIFILFAISFGGHAHAQLYRLDTNIIPDAYNITIKPYLLFEDGSKRFTFDGEVRITLHATIANVREITLHKDYIEIVSCALYNNEYELLQTISAEDISYETTTDKLNVKLSDALIANTNYTLHFVYTGYVRDVMAGLYRNIYDDENGIEKVLGVTQAQRIDARVIFPCFDEPALKATFELHAYRPKHYNVKFNTKLLHSEVIDDDIVLDHFDTTPPMSTYLVAFIVSEYVTRGDEDLALIIRPEYINKTDFSFDVAQRTLAAYDEYTKLPYRTLGNTLLQLAGVPTFPHNGMENWGLVIYKDSVLMHEPGYTDGWSNKEYTITIIVHETAHMWFGNSVTFAWWSYFWLNEGFARYFQYFLAHEIYPEYQLDQQFVVNQIHLIFSTDAVNSTQPLTSPEAEIETPSQLGWKFSSITYAKGAAIIRMICNLMGHNNFDNALRDYLEENHLGNVRPEQLFKHLKLYWPAEQNVDLDAFFYDWTEKVGYPMLMVTLSADKRMITVRQQRFLLNKLDGSDSQLRYTIPLTFTTDTNCNFDDLMPRMYFYAEVTSWSWVELSPIKWVIFNLQQSNYHRVQYDESLLGEIQSALTETNHSGVHVINRAHIVDDLFNFALGQYTNYVNVLSFLEYMPMEKDYLPWYAAFKGLQRIADRLTVQQNEDDDFTSYLFAITVGVYDKLGLQQSEDTVLDVYNRNKVVAWLCKYGHKDCNEQARQMLLNVNETNVKPIPDFRKTLYCAAVRFGEYKYYTLLEQWYEQETLNSEKEMLLSAMGCTYHFMETHYLNVLLNVPLAYKEIAIKPLYAENPERVTPVFAMISDTIERLITALGGEANAANIISDIANYFTTVQQQELLQKFIEEKGHLFVLTSSTLYAALDKVEANLQWADVYLPDVKVYLKSRRDSASALSKCTVLLLLFPLYLLTLH